MADEIQVTAQLSLNSAEGIIVPKFGVKNLLRDQDGTDLMSGTLELTTSPSQVNTMTEFGSPGGYCFLQHISENDQIRVGTENDYLMTMYPGDIALFRLGNNTFQAEALTSVAKLYYIIFEN
tara:strand:- start:437 stop:802 length:366 start_codon:yes stop_codon:yes gene_type:complete